MDTRSFTTSSAGQPLSGQPGVLRVDPATVLTMTGICCIVLGGLVAAVTGPFDLAHGSWAAAYLVLVNGVTQCAMGCARARQRVRTRSPLWGWAQTVGWNAGGALVIAGTLAGEPLVVDLGSLLLVATLAIALHATRAIPGITSGSSALGVPQWVALAYRALLLVLAVSIPIGMVLAHLRHS